MQFIFYQYAWRRGGIFSFIVDDRVPLHITRQNSDRFYPKLAILYIHRYHTKINIKHSQDKPLPLYVQYKQLIYLLFIDQNFFNEHPIWFLYMPLPIQIACFLCVTRNE